MANTWEKAQNWEGMKGFWTSVLKQNQNVWPHRQKGTTKPHVYPPRKNKLLGQNGSGRRHRNHVPEGPGEGVATFGETRPRICNSQAFAHEHRGGGNTILGPWPTRDVHTIPGCKTSLEGGWSFKPVLHLGPSAPH